jgi:electron transfer flavoprotein alpha subunit
MSENKNLWVFIEVLNGSAKSVGLELLGPGRRRTDAMGEKLVAVVIGTGAEAAVKSAVAYGADQVIFVEGPDYNDYSTEAYTYAMEQLVRKYRPATILVGATSKGRDMGPRLAARLKTGLTADCTGLDINPETAS